MINSDNPRALIESALAHLDHILPAQAPIQDFVHHNTLHGYQHLPFEQALAENEALTGISGYLPEERYRELYAKDRINDKDLTAALAHHPDLHAGQALYHSDDKTITAADIYKTALRFDISAISISQLQWQIEELHILDTVQADVPDTVAHGYRGNSIRMLWEAILDKLGLQHAAHHPEDLQDAALAQTEEWLLDEHSGNGIHQQTRQQMAIELEQLLAQVGNELSLRGLLLALSGKDILDIVRPKLIRLCAARLDQGVAPWQTDSTQSFYQAWRANNIYDLSLFLHELPNWQQTINALPEDAIDAIILHLTAMDIAPECWEGYLQRVALEIAGWSGMMNWQQQHANQANLLADYLAIRLTLDRLWSNHLCHDLWKIDANTASIKNYFYKNLSEFLVRRRLYQGRLPEYLSQQANVLTIEIHSERSQRAQWQALADLIWAWEATQTTQQTHSVCDSGWRLFRLSQHLGLHAADIQALTIGELQRFLMLLTEFNGVERSKIWLYAYEYHYREQFFNAIRANENRGRWAIRATRPEAQVIFCMDEREESFRRHLEEHNPTIETLGAAGFFGVAMHYQGLDDSKTTALCPIVVTPAHQVHEVALANAQNQLAEHNKGRKRQQHINSLLLQISRSHLFVSQLVIDLIAPFTLLGLIAKTLLPSSQNRLVTRINDKLSPTVPSQLLFTSSDNQTIATPEQPKLGFTDTEQADRIANLLRIMGLTNGFAPIIVLMGHGSSSQNNPHRAAYDCGACSGRHGGPNARLFAAMANRVEVRQLLAERNIIIPEDTWFIGAEHNTCNEDIDWYDLNQLPAHLHTAFNKLQAELTHSRHLSAHERCRRLASAPRNPELKTALAHIQERAVDFSQVRPELGHATNAAAVIGRRAITQGAFFDRRVFLISYDASQDPEGKILENILLAVAPVGAGINLEYYFSTVNNERFGCGTKLAHNLTGFFAVMDGTSSDLRTGLPQQMVEIHEAMRLQLMVEAKNSVLERIYNEQASVRELVAGGWIHLSSKDPDSGDIYVFERGVGFVLWQGEPHDLAIHEKSPACYKDKTEPVAPALLKQ